MKQNACLMAILIAMNIWSVRSDDRNWFWYKQVENPHYQNIFNYVDSQSEKLFDSTRFVKNEKKHEAKLVFRISMPVFLKLFPDSSGIDKYAALQILFMALGVGFYVLIALFFEQFFAQKHQKYWSFLFLVALSITYLPRIFFNDFAPFGDAIAIFALVLALVNKNLVVVAICLMVAFCTDERAYAAAMAVPIYHVFSQHKMLSLSNIFRNKISIVALGAVILSVGLRFGIQKIYHIAEIPKTDLMQKDTILMNLKRLIEMYATLQGLCFFVPLGLYFALINKNYWLFVGVFLSSFLSIAAAFGVLDCSRSLFYLLPIVLVCSKITIEYCPKPKIVTQIFLAIAVLCVLAKCVGLLHRLQLTNLLSSS